eukprot:3122354-Amphidinium_carterae.1
MSHDCCCIALETEVKTGPSKVSSTNSLVQYIHSIHNVKVEMIEFAVLRQDHMDVIMRVKLMFMAHLGAIRV